jgi:biotin carboxylase
VILSGGVGGERHVNAPSMFMVGYGLMLLSHLDTFLPPASVVVLEDPDVIAKRRADMRRGRVGCLHSVLPARYHQDLECVGAATGFRERAGMTVRAVLPGQEYGVPGAAALADKLGLRGATPAAAAALTDKLLMREAAQAGGVLVPQWREVRGPADVARFAAGGPVVLKPANRQGSLGVQLLPPGSDIEAAWAVTTAERDTVMLPDRELAWRYIAERLVRGHEYSAEALVADGEIVFLNVTDKLTAGGRHPVELGHVVPAPVDPALREELAASMRRLVGALAFATGILHAEWMATADGLVFIECAGRIPGDSLVELIDLAYGSSLIRAMVAVLCGEPPDVPAAAARASAIRFVTAAPGVITGIDGVAAAAGLPGVTMAEVSATVGDQVSELRSSWDRIGEVIAVGATPAQAAARAAAASAAIRVRCAPAPAPASGSQGQL